VSNYPSLNKHVLRWIF